jgi:hypothetical protein
MDQQEEVVMVPRFKPGYQFHINKTIKMKAKSMHMAYGQHASDGQDRGHPQPTKTIGNTRN